MEINMTKVFVLGAPGSGTLKVSEELYSRDDFKKVFKNDPIYKRELFPKDIKWTDVQPVIDDNYQEGQLEKYEVASGWWLYKYYHKIITTYPDAIIICVSRNSRESLCTIGVNASSYKTIENHGGEDGYKQQIISADVEIANIAASLNANWKYIHSDETIFDKEFNCINSKDESLAKPATIKIAVGNL
jgi:hypothetical protein